MPEDLSPSQAARRIGTSPRTVQRWIEHGRLPATRVGGRWRVAIDAIDALVVTSRGDARTSAGPGAIHSLFIANRGEIATRIRRTCERLGIRTVVPTTEGDDALDLLDIDTVVAAAVAAGADALHPGFGFLAENADFAEAAAAADIIWVGPPPAAIRSMGDKASARRLAASLGIPILAGYDDPDQTDLALTSAAESLGYPILIKPAAGGGGKGMRTVRTPDRLDDALAGARREAAAAFGDDRLILERLVEGARHIEIQLLFDASGDGIHLGERDCSAQRRHQKILEESPSPAVGPDLRRRLGDAALTLGRAVGYVGAGTCEFLVDAHGAPTFLEMNTRLQVEHPVTELVTGRDLVAEQLRIATGERLVGVSPSGPSGHAVEVRLYAEDAEDDFLPATGRIERLDWPNGDGIRVDPGIEPGSEIGARFDPMLAKIIAWGPDRATALERLSRALDETLVLGVVTNLRFLRWLVREPVVIAGEVRTDTLERIWPPDDWSERAAIPDGVWQLAASLAVDTSAPTGSWAAGWRLNSPPAARLSADGETRTVPAVPLTGAADETWVRAGDTIHVDLAGRSVAFRLADAPDVDASARAAVVHGATTSTGSTEVLAPMPGSVLHLHVGPGQVVDVGDPIVTLEAMKMEHAVVAPSRGRLSEFLVAPGDQVARRQRLAVIEAAP